MNVAVIGCGYGRESALMAPYVKHIYGIDVSRKILNKAVNFLKNKGFDNFTPVLADSWRYDINVELDFVYEITVFQHLTRDMTKDYISGMAEKLSNRGKMLLQFMEPEFGTRDAELKKYEPCVNWTKEDIQALAKELDLKILKTEDKYWPLDKASWHWVLFEKNK
ncbi:class I SAM-dependent methyltransferase [Melioribacter sp. Ez-97]|uniref:class I SAM-dependent methyltransferase n=1 Tax=Melioribacter sp. Ez-97 TaxID=3423434 RepID=UPI003ED92EAF